MRTLSFLAVSVLLLAAFQILARLFAGHLPAAASWASAAFILLWLAISGANMWLGVARAGYSVAEELPIFLLLFGLPASVALVLSWKIL